MRITVTCPLCGQPTQIRPENRGLTLRCPHPQCGKPFKVMEDGEALPVADTAESLEVAVVTEEEGGPVVIEYSEEEPVVAEVVAEKPETMDWQAGPPPVRDELGRTEEPAPAAEPGTASWEPPAVVVGGTEVGDDYYAPPPSHKFRKLAMGLIVLLIIGIAGGGWYLLQTAMKQEAGAAEKAAKEYAEGNYAKSQRAFQDLAEKYPNSDKVGRYRFMAALSEIRGSVQGATPDVEKSLERVSAFLKEHGQKSLFKENRKDSAAAFYLLAEAAAAEAERKADPASLDRAKQAVQLAGEHGPALDDHAQKSAQLQARWQKAAEAVAAATARAGLLERLAAIAQERKPGGIEEAQQIFEARLKEHPRLAGDAELKSQLDALRANEHTWVRYTPIGQPLSAAAGREGEMPYLVITPMTQGQPGKSQDSDAVVLGMARGILYALGQSNGELRWAMRLGLDTQVFPIRLPASPPQPEIGLIYAAETNTLLGVDVQVGRLLWQHPLGAACTASPVLVGRRAFVATQDGVVHEIEVVDGRLLGRYEIGQPLTVAGAFDAATRRLYQPADHKRVYVLDVEANVCAGVLYTNHSAGSLRGPPIASESTLVLAESTSLGTMRVRSLTVAANVAETKIEPRADAYDVPGWSWFPPYFDGDTVAYVTDRGYLALFGVRRKTRDRPLFPLAPPLRVAGGPEGDMATGRAQVALQDLDQWWLLARGRLVKDRFDLYRQDLHRTGDEAHPLGMPLHESQLPTWNRPLVLVTQEPDQPRVFATAFSGPHNLIRWQRQLGMIGIRDPILVDGHCVAVDASGGVFHLPAAQAPLAGNEAWRTGGEWKASAWRPSQPPRFVKSADGHSAVVILYDQAAEMLVIRHFEPAKGLLERQFRFDVAPVGTPAALGNVLVVPCRDGNLYEFSLQGGSDAPLPLTWRDRNAGNQAAGHAVFLSPEQLLVTDGLRRLQQWQRGPAEKAWRKASERTLELPARIVSPPLVLAAAGSERQICVAQDGGTVHLISGSRLVTVQQWRLGAAITAGPFALGQRIGCVLENRRLVCLDPASPKPLWEHQVEGLGVQGEPQYADDAVLITDISGAFTWLDAKTGSVRDQQKLPFRAVPTAAAVPMAPGRALAPLSDGTLLLLGTRRSPQTRAD